MTVHKLTAGDGYTYLSRQVAAQDADGPGVGGLSAYYTAKGENPGRWLGSGLEALPGDALGPRVTGEQMTALFGEGRHPDSARIGRALTEDGASPDDVDRATRLGAPYRVFTAAGDFRRRCAVEYRELNAARGEARGVPIPAEDRARIRTSIALQMFTETYGRAPLNPRELSGHLARITRQTTTAVAGYDLTFSPVKSVSTLWAIAPPEVAAMIEAAHDDAVRDVVAWLEDHATYTRTGRRGVAQIDVHGLLATAFTHRDSRAGDPDLHTHVAISNKVQTPTGRWLALDGRPIYKNAVAASERYNTRLEALLTERLGVRFSERRDGDPGKRPVREIVGVDGPLPRMWSSRRAAIDTRRAALSAQFQTDHGRPPTDREAIQLAQQANLETRDAKHEPRSQAEQRAAWRTEAIAVLGSEDALSSYVDGALHPQHRRGSAEVTEQWIEDVARAAIDRVAFTRATWEQAHVRAEVERHARRAGVSSADLDAVVDRAVTKALSPPFSLRVTPERYDEEPEPLRRRDGSSVFDVAGSAVHTSEAVLSAERAVMDTAGRFDGHVTPAHAVQDALENASASGPPLNPGQVDFVRQLATSGARVQVGLAPAGTGKTTALGALATAWRAGGGTVIGLAPSAAASAVLRRQLADSTDTVAKFVHAMDTGVDVPAWLTSLGPGSLVIIDEAGAATTQDLAAVVSAVVSTGGSVRFVGDDQQLGAIGTGGLLTDLTRTYGAAHLTEVVRFTHADTGAPNTVEGAVSLALREGDPTALAFYADRDRLHVGDLATCLDQTFGAWATDRAAGRDALMLAPTRDFVRQLNERARADRLNREGASGREATLVDGTQASIGDVVITRRNDRTLANGASHWVTNGDRWTIAAVRPSGALDVVHNQSAELVTLPADYVRTHVTLGYASTVHGAQGVTADASYTVVTGTESRQQLYVALTRGRHTNHAFVAVTGDGDTHNAITRDGVLPPTAVDILHRILARDTAPTSATTARARETDPELQLAGEVDRYVHALATAAEDRLGAAGLSAIDDAADLAVPDLTDQPAYPALRATLALRAAAGHDPVTVLTRSVDGGRELADARDPAAVLDWRITTYHHTEAQGSLPWLDPIPASLTHDQQWGEYLTAQASRVREVTTEIATIAAAWTATSAPRWARPYLKAPDLRSDLAVWRAATGVDPSDPRPTGGPARTAAEATTQRQLDERVRTYLAETTTQATRWAERLGGAAPGITQDPSWPVLLDRLATRPMDDPDSSVLLDAATRDPLPDELPAAALWWRLLEHLPQASELAAQRSPTVTAPPAEEPSIEPRPPTAAAPARTTSAGAPRADPGPGPEAAEGLALKALTRERVLELNQLAADLYTSNYEESWAQGYLIGRLGADPALNTGHVIGCAPTGWTGLVDRLRGRGITDDELIGSGLASRASTGRLIDRFRNRVVFAIRDDDGIVGWIGRRHPDDDRRPHPAIPKYLNTPETITFTKGDHLFGLTDERTTIERGGTPVVVEGPLDALAVTIAGAGEFVGTAPLGTAFTSQQAARLMRSQLGDGHSPIMAMDADRAGRRAAERIFWQLGSASPTRSAVLPAGQDPADVLRIAGPAGLRRTLQITQPLINTLLDARINDFADQLDTVEGRVIATRRAAVLIAAAPPVLWPTLLTHVVARTGIAPDIALTEVLHAAGPGTPERWRREGTDSKAGQVARHESSDRSGLARRPSDRMGEAVSLRGSFKL